MRILFAKIPGNDISLRNSYNLEGFYETAKDPSFPSFRIGNRIFINRLKLQEWANEMVNKK
jgi:hypothetical protein